MRVAGAVQDAAAETGRTVSECLPVLVIADRAQAGSMTGGAPAAVDDFGGFDDFGTTPAPAAAADDFGDFGFDATPAPAAAAAAAGADDFGDFGFDATPAPAAATTDGADFGGFNDDFAAPAAAPLSPAAAKDDGLFCGFDDTIPAPAAPAAPAPDGLGGNDQPAADQASDGFGSFDASAPANLRGDFGLDAAEDDAAAKAKAEVKAAAEAKVAAAAAAAAEEEKRVVESSLMSSRHSAALSSRSERLAESLRLERDQLQGELRELKMLKSGYEDRLEEQRTGLEETEEQLLALKKKHREELAKVRASVCPLELKVRTLAHTKQLGWCVEFESRVMQGNANLADVLAEFKDWQVGVKEQQAEQLKEERGIAQTQIAEAVKEVSLLNQLGRAASCSLLSRTRQLCCYGVFHPSLSTAVLAVHGATPSLSHCHRRFVSQVTTAAKAQIISVYTDQSAALVAVEAEYKAMQEEMLKRARQAADDQQAAHALALEATKVPPCRAQNMLTVCG